MILKGLVLLLLGFIYLPLILIAIPLLDVDKPVDTLTSLIQSAQFLPALRATFTSTILSVTVALGLSTVIVSSLLFTPKWGQLTRRIPFLLAFPHLVFAVGTFILIGPRGWFERLLIPLGLDEVITGTFWLQDALGVSLGIVLGIKEAWFLCWILWAYLQRFDMHQHYLIGQTLGYGRLQIMISLIGPQLLPALKWPLVAITAYSLSSIEMAVVLGPTNPPTLAMLGWQMLLDANPLARQQGFIISILLIMILGLFIITFQPLFRRSLKSKVSGKRWFISSVPGAPILSFLFFLQMLMIMLIMLWSLAQSWFYPSLLPDTYATTAWLNLTWEPFANSLMIGISASLIVYVVVIMLLEALPKTQFNWLMIPILVPALPLVVAQHQVLVKLGIEPSWISVFWSHLIFVFPYVFLLMTQAYKHFDKDQILAGKALGLNQWQILLSIKLPLLLKPSLAAVALGFTVSLAQYLPTEFIGAGRVETLTTETVTRFAGGNKRVLGAQASLLMLQAFLIYMMAIQAPKWIYANKRGMH